LKRFVLDCSVTLAWCFKDETAAYAAAVLRNLNSAQGIVPTIWPLEVANALLVCERRKRLTEADTVRFLAFLQAMPIVVDEETASRALDDILFLARDHNLSSYDAAYLELAMRQGYPLASLDDRLRKAATRAGVDVLK